ncbi:MAG: hypothetical protein AAGA44_07825 [Pseudomonadota bacterium]
MTARNVKFEGLTPDEILDLEVADVDELVFNGEDVVVNIGSAQILGQFSLRDDVMVIELAQIDGGGEGVLPAIGSLASKLAKQREIREIEWQVHAVTCAQPNLKLRQMLVRRGFEIRRVDGVGEVYHQVSAVGGD